ncbi:unnamed protein product [Miscanthus lutarioriparius]|uniref:BED-type domain-containing protein n=1 Tax=Miscanthus lutarioriparius TaxID=422564 RepID=A0A811QMY9_9POAL|nr:unnamed protein product [Miscanthus lutarioriparius]
MTALTSRCPPLLGLNLLRRNSDDVGWEYRVLVDANNKDKVKCNLCDKVVQGGIYRLKQHVAHEGQNATKCKARTSEALEAKEKCKKALNDAKRKREEKIVRELKLRDEVNVSRVGAIPFNACDNDEFKQIVEAIGQFGAGLEPPTQYDLRKTLLEEEYTRTKSLLQEREAEKLKNGCSIMTDAWIDRKRRSIMNLCTNCANGTCFISTKEMSNVSYTCEVVFELVDKAIEDIDSPLHLTAYLIAQKREIKEAFGNNESRFKEVIVVIDKKMKGRLDSPLHLTAYLLNPHYSYSNPSIFDEPIITEGFISCVETFYYHDEDKQDQATNIELKKF